jgi:hypothetical protein
MRNPHRAHGNPATDRGRPTHHCDFQVFKEGSSENFSVRHRSDFFFHFHRINHHDGIPRTPIQEAPIRTLAEALLAANAQDRINLDAPKRRIVLVRHPKHAIFHGTVLHTRRRTRAACAALRNYGKFLWLLLACGCDSLRARLKLLLVGHHSRRFNDIGCVGHFQRF